MSQETIPLLPVDHVEIMIILDNSIDVLMTSTDVAKRVRLGPHPFDRPHPVAEHGFSVLIKVKRGNTSRTVLFDTGISPRNLLYNVDALEIKLSDIQSVILSHGHPDHAMGLPGLTQRLGSRNLPLLLHPDAYLERKGILPNGEETFLPVPRKADLLRENIQVIEEVGPLEHSEAACPRDGLRAVAGSQFREYIAHVPLDGIERDDQPLGNLLVGSPACQQMEYFLFAST
jgi:7,8-dihydropterin-6-yl-methyl-4-(beta-D-ribofuranosyl)aminobenzene 5'-phosphate synthase